MPDNNICYYVFEPEFRGGGYSVSYIYDIRNGSSPSLGFVQNTGTSYTTSAEAWKGFCKKASVYGRVFDCRNISRNCLDIINQDSGDENSLMVSIGTSDPYAYRMPGLKGHDLFVAVAERLIEIIKLFPFPETGVWNFNQDYPVCSIAYRNAQQTNREVFDRYLETRRYLETLQEEQKVYSAELAQLTQDQINDINTWATNFGDEYRIICHTKDHKNGCEYCQGVLDRFIAANPTYFAPTLVEQTLSIVEQQIQEAEERGYARGHEEGVSAGNEAGYTTGFDDGYQEGRMLGDQESYDQGYQEGGDAERDNLIYEIKRLLDNL